MNSCFSFKKNRKNNDVKVKEGEKIMDSVRRQENRWSLCVSEEQKGWHAIRRETSE